MLQQVDGRVREALTSQFGLSTSHCRSILRGWVSKKVKVDDREWGVKWAYARWSITMVPVEFQTTIENGVIVVPDEYKQDLSEGSSIKVTVVKQPKKRISETKMLAELMRNPIPVPGVRSITREEMHDRNL